MLSAAPLRAAAGSDRGADRGAVGDDGTSHIQEAVAERLTLHKRWGGGLGVGGLIVQRER
eukprot:4585824-Prymnesium_polylepis.2